DPGFWTISNDPAQRCAERHRARDRACNWFELQQRPDNPNVRRPAPCRPNAFSSPVDEFFPLTIEEKAVLLRMYPASWKKIERLEARGGRRALHRGRLGHRNCVRHRIVLAWSARCSLPPICARAQQRTRVIGFLPGAIPQADAPKTAFTAVERG